MRRATAVICLCIATILSAPAHGAVVFLPDRVIDTRTQLVWLNVWEGDALVNPHHLADVAGGWRHADANQLSAFFFGQFGVAPFMGAPFQQTVVDLMLHLGGRTSAHPILTPTGIVAASGYTITGWYRSDFFPQQASPTFDEITLEYMGDSATGLWYSSNISTIGSWTSLDDHPHPITFPQPHFLISALVPEPPVVALLALALGALLVRQHGLRQ